MTGAILQAASWLVPRGRRAEWLAEWRSEFWHVRNSRGRSVALIFSLGSFRDALWLRRNLPVAPQAFGPASPVHCIAVLAACAALTFVGTRQLPSFRSVPGLVAISHGRQPTVSYEKYRSITTHAWRPFSAIAFWEPVRMQVQAGGGSFARTSVALATPSLAGVLGISAAVDRPAVLLSTRAWRVWFASDPAVAGRPIEIGGRQARVAGIVSPGALRAPVPVDAWLLDPEPPPDAAKGFVLATVKTPPGDPRLWSIAAPNRGGGWDHFECTPLDRNTPIFASVVTVLMSLVFLPLITSLRLGDYPATAHSPRRAIRLRRWCFLGLKLALVCPSVFWAARIVDVVAPGMQAHALLVGYLLAFRWALIDQRRRCPVCLRTLTNPTSIGSSSQMFLEWCGTELICARGHGLLHVPEIETSCYSGQRWLYLDSSWRSLFS